MERMSLADWQDSPDERPALEKLRLVAFGGYLLVNTFDGYLHQVPSESLSLPKGYELSILYMDSLSSCSQPCQNSKTFHAQSMHQAGPGMASIAASQNERVMTVMR